MKLFILLLAGISTAILTGCQSKPSIPASAGAGKLSTDRLRRLVGVWVRQDTSGAYKGGFQLMRINPDSTGTLTFFLDYSQAVGKQFLRQHPDAPRYSFIEDSLRVRYRPHTDSTRQYIPNLEVQIWTAGVRFDYELDGDTLREIDKMGYQGSLVRMPTSSLRHSSSPGN